MKTLPHKKNFKLILTLFITMSAWSAFALYPKGSTQNKRTLQIFQPAKITQPQRPVSPLIIFNNKNIKKLNFQNALGTITLLKNQTAILKITADDQRTITFNCVTKANPETFHSSALCTHNESNSSMQLTYIHAGLWTSIYLNDHGQNEQLTSVEQEAEKSFFQFINSH